MTANTHGMTVSGSTQPRSPRTLPFRVAPFGGESLQSWLATTAARGQTPWYVLFKALGPTPSDSATKKSHHLDEVVPSEQLSNIAVATGLDERRIAAMTLAGSGVASIHLNVDGRVTTPWGRPVPWRHYCPACLRESGGRWSLQWKLPWAALCVEHGCLLNDTCPECGFKQYGAPGSFVDRQPPRPLMCSCGADLGTAPLRLVPTQAMVEAQQSLNAIIATESIDIGIYAHTTVSGDQLMADIRRLANRILVAATPQSLAEALDSERPGAVERWLDHLWQPSSDNVPASTRFTTNGSCDIRATGTLAALQVLRQPTFETAATVLRSMIDLDRGTPVRPGDHYRGYRPSAELCAVEIVSQSCRWDELGKIRFRVYDPLPRRLDSLDATQEMLRNVPTLLWCPLAAAVDVIEHGLAWSTYCQTLSWLLLEIGARPTERTIRDGLLATTERKRVHEFVETMRREPRWTDVAAALTRLHAFLTAHPSPIDYRRRRQLDYTDILTAEQWNRLWKHAEAVHRPVPVAAARIWLYERLSGSAAGTRSPFVGVRHERDRLLRRMTPGLQAALDHHALAFLARRGIADEPVVWMPPFSVLGQWTHTRSEGQCRVDDLHSLLRSERCTLPQAARTLGAPLPLVRDVLTRHPMPPRTPSRKTWKQQLAERLNDEQLRRLYLGEGLTFKEIGIRYGIPDMHVAERAHECGIPLHRPPRDPIPAQWIRQHHLGQGQTLGEMAVELGDSVFRLRYWADRHGISLRRYYRREGEPGVSSYAEELGVHELLGPLLADKSDWRRLRRFAVACGHVNLADAARAIGCRQDVLCRQITMLEGQFGFALINRTTSRYKAMTTTTRGQQVATAVLRIEHRIETDRRRATLEKS